MLNATPPMGYQTRHLVAAREMQHDGYSLKVGDKFTATPVDANYLVSRGKATEAGTEADSKPQAAALTPRRGRPPGRSVAPPAAPLAAPPEQPPEQPAEPHAEAAGEPEEPESSHEVAPVGIQPMQST